MILPQSFRRPFQCALPLKKLPRNENKRYVTETIAPLSFVFFDKSAVLNTFAYICILLNNHLYASGKSL